MQEVVIARVTANWLQRNTRDNSQDAAKREVVRERQNKKKTRVLYEAGGGGWTVGSDFGLRSCLRESIIGGVVTLPLSSSAAEAR